MNAFQKYGLDPHSGKTIVSGDSSCVKTTCNLGSKMLNNSNKVFCPKIIIILISSHLYLTDNTCSWVENNNIITHWIWFHWSPIVGTLPGRRSAPNNSFPFHCTPCPTGCWRISPPDPRQWRIHLLAWRLHSHSFSGSCPLKKYITKHPSMLGMKE